MKDPIVEEVRKHRMEHTREHDGDLDAICKALKATEEASGHKIVRRPAKRLRQDMPKR